MIPTKIPKDCGPEPEGRGAAASHLVYEHGWDAMTAIDHQADLLAAHLYAHGGLGRPDLADPELGHAHLPVAAPAQTIDWRGGYLPAFLTGLVLTAAGLFMPWMSAVVAFIGQFSIKGLDTSDGKILGGAVLILAAIAYGEARASHPQGRAALLVGALILIGFVSYEYADMTSRLAEINDEDFGRASVGYGLYISGAGAAIAAIAAALRIGKRG